MKNKDETSNDIPKSTSALRVALHDQQKAQTEIDSAQTGLVRKEYEPDRFTARDLDGVLGEDWRP